MLSVTGGGGTLEPPPTEAYLRGKGSDFLGLSGGVSSWVEWFKKIVGPILFLKGEESSSPHRLRASGGRVKLNFFLNPPPPMKRYAIKLSKK